MQRSAGAGRGLRFDARPTADTITTAANRAGFARRYDPALLPRLVAVRGMPADVPLHLDKNADARRATPRACVRGRAGPSRRGRAPSQRLWSPQRAVTIET